MTEYDVINISGTQPRKIWYSLDCDINRTKWLKIRFWKLKFRDLSMFFLIPSLHSRIYCRIWQRSCGDHMRPHCVRTASSWRPRRPHCAVTALPLRTHCVRTALIQIAVGTPSAVAWRPRRPHGVQWRCHGDPSALWVFFARRAVAVRTPPWCDRGFTNIV